MKRESLATALSAFGVEQFRDAKVEQLRFALRRHADVRRLDVAMNDQMLVRVGDGRANFAKKVESLLHREPACLAIVVESVAFHIFHGEKWNSIRGHAAAVKLRDVRMIQAGEETLFVFEVAKDVVCVHAATNELERGFAIQFSIVREINFAHSAAADERQNFVIADYLTGVVRATLAHERFGCEMQGRLLDESVRRFLMFEERFDFRAQRRIRSAFLIEKRRPPFGSVLNRGFDQFRQPRLPARQAFAAFSVSSRRSQSLAKFQSRKTVFAETSSTSAISFASRPPKNFNSTTMPSRG